MNVPTPASMASLVSRAALAVFVGMLCYGVSCTLVAPGPMPVSFGAQWQQMSEAPLDLRGQFPHRMLSPLIAHCLGMGGERFVEFTRGLAIMLLSTVFFFTRCRGGSIVDALLITTTVAVTAAVQMYKQHWIGYVDQLTYTLFLWMWLAAGRPTLFWVLFLANLLNHELAVFMFPWLWFVRRQACGSIRADALGAGMVFAAYGGYYIWVKAHAPAQTFSIDYFAGHPLFPGGTFVVVMLALTHLVVAFGPVMLVLAWHQGLRKHGPERWHLWLVLAGVLAIFCIAFDWARHSNLIVLPLTVAALRFQQAGHRAVFTMLIAASILLMLCLPPWSPVSWPTNLMANETLLVESGMIVDLGHGGPLDIGFGSLSSALTRWLPKVWNILGAAIAILAAICFAGWWMARVDARRSGCSNA